jgi:hypothetical protein
MANRYWVGGSGTWNTTSTTNWSASSGGASGASVPTQLDSVFFDQAGTYTVTCTGNLRALDFTVSAGTVTFATGTSPSFNIAGSLSLLAGTVWSSTGIITFSATTTGKTVTTNGTTIQGAIAFSGAGGGWTLGSALTSNGGVTITQGTFDTSSSGNYAITSSSFGSSSSNTRTVNLNASTITCSTGGSTVGFTTIINLTFNAGTSQINLTSATAGINSNGITFYNVSFTSTSIGGAFIAGVNTFNNLTITGRTSVGIGAFELEADQTINGTLTLGAGTAAAYRTFLTSDVTGTQRTLTCAAISSVTDFDFRDINFAGAISLPVTGTRLGDCKGNNNITFPAAKTVYWRQTTSANWGISVNGAWSATSGGALDATMFPLAQDTAVFPAATYPSSGSTATINGNYNIGTIDMSLRTSNTMTLSTGTTTPQIYGNWINGTGITLSGTGRMTFAGRTIQQITSAGKPFTQLININSPSGSVALQDAATFSAPSVSLMLLNAGTFDANGYNVTLSYGGSVGLSVSGTNTRTFAFGSGTFTIAGSGTVWNATTATNLTVTGTGTISLTSASAKTFIGGGIQTYPTINQGGLGALTITGSNKFANITNTVNLTSVLFTGGTTNIFTSFNLTGILASLVTLSSTNTTQATLQKGSTWFMGANSTDSGNNTGLTFSAGGGIDYLNVSYINGTVVGAPTYAIGGQFLAFF